MPKKPLSIDPNAIDIASMGSSSARPLCVLACGQYTQESELRNILYDNNIALKVAKSAEELLQLVQSPHCFLVFVNPQARPDLFDLLLRIPKHAGNFRWIGITKRSSFSEHARLLQLGAADVLLAPAHPTTIKSRACIQYNKYLESLSSDPAPKGIQESSPKEIALKRTLDLIARPNQNFERIEDVADRLRVLRFASLSRCQSYLWTAGRDLRIPATVELLDEERLELSLRIKPRTKQDLDRLQQHAAGGNGIHCNLQLGAGNVFLREVFKLNGDLLILEVSHALFGRQRRLAVRSSWQPPHAPMIELQSPRGLLRAWLKDASATGLGITAASSSLADFQVGEALAAQLSLGNQHFKLEVMTLWHNLHRQAGLAITRAPTELLQIIEQRALDAVSSKAQQIFRT
jgi:hypothetical protein